MLSLYSRMEKLSKLDFKTKSACSCGCATIKEETEEEAFEKYCIISNGKRYKKDSRNWLHKTTDRINGKRSKSENPPLETSNKTTGSDSCNGKNNNKVSFFTTFRESELQNVPVTKPIKSCIRNIEENANGPEMFRRKNKRRLKSPSLGKSPPCVRFDDSVEAKLKNFIKISKSFKPIQPDFSASDRFSDSSEYDCGTNTFPNLFDDNSWRHFRTISSDDGSTTPTPSESSSYHCIPVKRSKKQEVVIEYSNSSRLSWDSTPSDRGSDTDVHVTPCGSPLGSFSMDDRILCSENLHKFEWDKKYGNSN